MSGDHEHDLFGTGLLGDALSPKRQGNLAERFLIPPFTVLSARDGWWQSRKRSWISLGIQSELGRGGDLTFQGDVAHDLDHYRHKEGTRSFKDKASPGGAPMPAANYANRERGNGSGRAIPNTTAAPPVVPVIVPAITAAARPAPAPVAPVGAAPVHIVPRPSAVAFASPEIHQWTDPFLAHHAERLAAAGLERMKFDDDLAGTPSPVVFDVEVYKNFFVVCLRRTDDGRTAVFEMSERCALDRDGLVAALRVGAPLVSFNGIDYDMLIVALALSGADCARIKEASDKIVKSDANSRDLERELGVRPPEVDHVDLMWVSPSRQSLKMLHARLGGKFIVDLPFDEEKILTPEEMNVVTLYCLNDLDATGSLVDALREPLKMRYGLTREHQMDLRSKSDAQVGEAIVRRRVELALGRRLARPTPAPTTFRYEPPAFLRFEDPRLRAIVDALRETEFCADEAGNVATPAVLVNATVNIGSSSYRMGKGGLHSQEAARSLYSDDHGVLLDVDVSSQYPNIIRKLGLHPPALGPAFLDVYGKIIDERLAAKTRMEEIRAIASLEDERASLKVKIDGQKIQTNGVFGKLGSSYSVLFDPRLLMATTLTGQLSILSLIDRVEASGISVVSANTDGVTMLCPRLREDDLRALIGAWETETGFEVEWARYRSLHSASVNTYLAIKEDGKLKRKGLLADPWAEGDLRGQMSKNPQMTILGEAVLGLIRDDVPIAETVGSSNDPRKFVTVINVRGGGQWRGHRLGRVVRYFWSTMGAPITYVSNGNRVPKTEGARPMVELTDALPADLDRARYAREAEKLAADVGFLADEEGLLQ